MTAMADIRVHIDTLVYTRTGLRTEDPISLKTGEHNRVVLVRPERRAPVAQNAGTFAHDSCFPNPGVLSVSMLAAAQNLANLVLGLNPTSIFQIYGHAEPSGDAAHNKNLSDRRARAFEACLTGDVEAFLALSDSEEWGTYEHQIMLRTLKCDPGPIDGMAEELTHHATFLFQSEYSEGVFHRHLPERQARENLKVSGKIDGSTERALLEAYILSTSAFIPKAQLHPSHPRVGCSEFNLVDPDMREKNRRVSLIVHPSLPEHHAAAPCTEANHDVCPIDGRDTRSTCLWYREHVQEHPTRLNSHRFFDLRWLELEDWGWLLSALTTLPDGANVTFEPFRTRLISPDDSVNAECLGESLHPPMEGLVRGGVAQLVWKPAEGSSIAYPQLAFLPGADPRTAAPHAAVASFVVSGGGVHSVAPPPGRELVRLPNRADVATEGRRGFLAVDSFGRVFQHDTLSAERDAAEYHPLRDDEPRIRAKRPLQHKFKAER